MKGNGPVPFWSHDNLIAVAWAKLRRLLLGIGERNKRNVRFIYADAFETFHLADFIYVLMRGSIALVFDCREAKPGSDGLRDHGTKFRITPTMTCRLDLKKERLSWCQAYYSPSFTQISASQKTVLQPAFIKTRVHRPAYAKRNTQRSQWRRPCSLS